MAVEECVTQDGDFPMSLCLASADSAAGRMTRRSLGGCALNCFSGHWRSRVGLLGTTGLPVGLHLGPLVFRYSEHFYNFQDLWEYKQKLAVKIRHLDKKITGFTLFIFLQDLRKYWKELRR